eukprot:SAG11_NODE_4215_length_2009_cov_5.452880_1_plen_168_part_00
MKSNGTLCPLHPSSPPQHTRRGARHSLRVLAPSCSGHRLGCCCGVACRCHVPRCTSRDCSIIHPLVEITHHTAARSDIAHCSHKIAQQLACKWPCLRIVMEQRPHVMHRRSPKSAVLILPWPIVVAFPTGWRTGATTLRHTITLCPALSSRQVSHLPGSEESVMATR